MLDAFAMLIRDIMRRLLIPFAMAWTCAGVVIPGLKDAASTRYMRCRALLVRRAQEIATVFCWFLSVPSAATTASMPSPSNSNRRSRDRLREIEDRNAREDRAWGDMRGRHQLTQQRGDRVDYLVFAQLYEMDGNRSSHEPQPLPSGFPPPLTSASASTSTRPPAAGDSGAGNLHGPRRGSAQTLRRPSFTAEEQHYLQSRLPIRQPATAATAVNHFRRLPFLYSDLAEGYRLRLASLSQGTPEWQRRRKMAVLAQAMADRYHRFRLVLPRSYIEHLISNNQGETRTSKFWEKVLDETEKANQAWAVVPLWVLLFVVQSSLVAAAFHLLPAPAQVVLLLANGLAYTWSVTVMCEMLHSRYTNVKTDEQELHDLMGGLLRPI